MKKYTNEDVQVFKNEIEEMFKAEHKIEKLKEELIKSIRESRKMILKARTKLIEVDCDKMFRKVLEEAIVFYYSEIKKDEQKLVSLSYEDLFMDLGAVVIQNTTK